VGKEDGIVNHDATIGCLQGKDMNCARAFDLVHKHSNSNHSSMIFPISFIPRTASRRAVPPVASDEQCAFSDHPPNRKQQSDMPNGSRIVSI
jgi:hypothetical protein